jgi:hypothetical protein
MQEPGLFFAELIDLPGEEGGCSHGWLGPVRASEYDEGAATRDIIPVVTAHPGTTGWQAHGASSLPHGTTSLSKYRSAKDDATSTANCRMAEIGFGVGNTQGPVCHAKYAKPACFATYDSIFSLSSTL